MAISSGAILDKDLREKVQQTRIFVVGAGGIGCELIKNLVLTGFEDIELIDLDTIDVSNLNRQFLFRKEHVGKAKAIIARESALKFNPDAKIVAHHDSIMSNDYGVDFFKKFTLVMNALDNRAARNHVNRMCLAANIPLIESGTAGYLGQVTVIKKGATECYECKPKPAQKTFPGCTIRNTPSEPIHCIVWAKHLFNQLFGEEDPDQDVSPDTEDPEAAGDAGESALESSKANTDNGDGAEQERKSTRLWAQETGYDADKIFHKLFRDDIKYLLSMENLWKKRRPPTPIDLQHIPKTEEDHQIGVIEDQKVWTISECVHHFRLCLKDLKDQFQQQGDGGMLVWDKDDKAAMDFVTSTANIRAHIFGIPVKSRFDIKSMAGNIIPAIATTNAVIAGLIVMEGVKILNEKFDQCRTVYLNRQPNPRKKLLNPCLLDPPNPKCYVCSDKPEVTVVLNTEHTTVKTLEDKILKVALGMVAPDVEIDDGKGTIIISSEEGETEENATKFLKDFNIQNGTRLKVDDFQQVYILIVNIVHVEKLEEEKEFEVIGDISELKDKVAKETADQNTSLTENGQSNGNGKASTSAANQEDDEDDLMVVEEEDLEEAGPSTTAAATNDDDMEDEGANAFPRKRKADDNPSGSQPKKRRSNVVEIEDDDIVIL